MILTGCEHTRSAPQTDDDTCPAELQNQIRLSAAAVPTTIPSDFTPSEDRVQRYGLLGRRLTISVSSEGGLRGVRTLSNTLTITPLGGSFLGWARTSNGSRASLEVIPGRIRVTPFLQNGNLQPQTSWLDVLVMPGGIPVDEMAIHAEQLWNADGHPVEPGRVQIKLTPIEHLSILDVVEANIDLDYRVERSHREWQCAAHSNLTLVDHEAVRPALWDLGTPTPESHGKRAWWLALVSSNTGPFRVIFTNLAEAHGFATWLLQTRATRVGQYDLALVQPNPSGAQKPITPVDWTVVERSRAASESDLQALRVGRIGEP
jgi:hypothetical protein